MTLDDLDRVRKNSGLAFSSTRFYRTMLCIARLWDCMLSVCPSVRPSVTFRYRDHMGWNTSKIISRPNSLRHLLTLTPTWVCGATGTSPKLEWNTGGLGAQKRAKSPKRRKKDQDYYDELIWSHIRAFDWYKNKWPWMTLNGWNVTLAEINKIYELKRKRR